MPGLASHRVDLIVPGLLLIDALTRRVGASRLVVGGHGLRDGIFYRWLRPAPANAVVADVLEESVANCMRLYRVRSRRALRVARLAVAVFDGLSALHRLGEAERRAVRIAACLRDVGGYVDPYHRDDHTYYLVRKLPLFGLAAWQRECIAAATAFDDGAAHRERCARGGLPGMEALSARLGWMVALADLLADFVPARGAPPALRLEPGLVVVAVAGCDPSAVSTAGNGLAEDFRLIFERPLAFARRELTSAAGRPGGRLRPPEA